MWARIDDTRLIETYSAGFPERAAPPVLCDLLRQLQRQPWPERIWAATSHNQLRLTTAPSWREEDRHPRLLLSDRAGHVSIAYVPAGARRSESEAMVPAEHAPSMVSRWVTDHLLRAS